MLATKIINVTEDCSKKLLIISNVDVLEPGERGIKIYRAFYFDIMHCKHIDSKDN